MLDTIKVDIWAANANDQLATISAEARLISTSMG